MHSLFTDLVKGEHFPHVTIVITGRPSACVSLPPRHIKCKILIFGFTKTKVDMYSDGTQVTQKIPSQLAMFLQICVLFLAFYNRSILSNHLPCSFSELYKRFILYLLNCHKEDVYGDNRKIKHFGSLSIELPVDLFNILQNLARLAFENLLQNNARKK